MIRSSGLESFESPPCRQSQHRGHSRGEHRPPDGMRYFVITRLGAVLGVCSAGNHESDPCVPAVGTVLVGELPVAFAIEVPLRRGAQGNDEAELRPDTNYT